MDSSQLIIICVISGLVYFLIFYLLMTSAVRIGTDKMLDKIQSVNYNLKMQNRFLIKYLNQKGVSKQELASMHDWDNDTFWRSIPDDESQPK